MTDFEDVVERIQRPDLVSLPLSGKKGTVIPCRKDRQPFDLTVLSFTSENRSRDFRTESGAHMQMLSMWSIVYVQLVHR